MGKYFFSISLQFLFLCSMVSISSGSIQRCLICHGRVDLKKVFASGRVKSLYVDVQALAGSVHATKTCTDCHADITEIPHSTHVKTVDCTYCHYKGNPTGAPQTDKYMDYQQSIHGKAVAAGNTKAPVCQDCHGSHQIKRHNDPASQVYKTHIPKTCGRCHLEIYAQYQTSIHGQVIAAGKLDAPVCTDCHGEHNIKAPNNPESKIYVTNVPKTCSSCHAAEGIVGKYGIKVEQVTTYEESYHGVAIMFGAKTVANCASCHGVHDIRPPQDPSSSVYIKNIPKTCGKCHPGANINYAKGKIHVQRTQKDSGSIFYVNSFFRWLTFMVMLGLVAHIALDLNRKFKEKRSAQGHKSTPRKR